MKQKRIVITGSEGFLGQHLVRKFRERGYQHIISVDYADYDLVKLENIQRMYQEQKPDIVVHLAAKVGGIGYNQ